MLNAGGMRQTKIFKSVKRIIYSMLKTKFSMLENEFSSSFSEHDFVSPSEARDKTQPELPRGGAASPR